MVELRLNPGLSPEPDRPLQYTPSDVPGWWREMSKWQQTMIVLFLASVTSRMGTGLAGIRNIWRKLVWGRKSINLSVGIQIYISIYLSTYRSIDRSIDLSFAHIYITLITLKNENTALFSQKPEVQVRAKATAPWVPLLETAFEARAECNLTAEHVIRRHQPWGQTPGIP